VAKDDHPADSEWSWASEALEHYSSGIDRTQIEERLKLTPTERLERMRQFLLFLEEAKGGEWPRTSKG
jgi:hypothetical protein